MSEIDDLTVELAVPRNLRARAHTAATKKELDMSNSARIALDLADRVYRYRHGWIKLGPTGHDSKLTARQKAGHVNAYNKAVDSANRNEKGSDLTDHLNAHVSHLDAAKHAEALGHADLAAKHRDAAAKHRQTAADAHKKLLDTQQRANAARAANAKNTVNDHLKGKKGVTDPKTGNTDYVAKAKNAQEQSGYANKVGTATAHSNAASQHTRAADKAPTPALRDAHVALAAHHSAAADAVPVDPAHQARMKALAAESRKRIAAARKAQGL